MILTPAHGALPSGHATEAFIAAMVLWQPRCEASGGKPSTASMRLSCEQLLRLASASPSTAPSPACTSRSTAPPAPCSGLTLGAYFVARCEDPSPKYDAYEFDGTQFPPTTGGPLADGDFYWTLYYNTAVGGGSLRRAPTSRARRDWACRRTTC